MTERVEELLDQYLDLRLGGAEVEIEGLLAEHPELEEREREQLRRLAGLLGKQANGSTSDSGQPPSRVEDVGPYRILRELGQGGQGAVFLAEDTRFARRVALKVLNRAGLDLGGDGRGRDSAARLKREAEVVSRLDHPSICVVYEMGATKDAHYIAMRYVEGETLAKKIAAARAGEEPFGKSAARHGRRLELAAGGEGPAASGTPPSTGRRSVERILALAEQCARALHVAHEAGVVHRDVKPGNIMVTPEGEPVLLDFGLARDLEQGTATLTVSGGLLGTPAYMSPEQLTSGRGPVDRRADVYALGVTLYECLTLARPFEAPTRELLYRLILTEPPSRPGRINASIPRDLEVVLETALEKDADHRYQTALDFAEDLRRVRQHEPIRARPAGLLLRATRWIQRNPVLAATLGALFLALTSGLAIALHLLGRERSALVAAEGRRLIADAQAALPTSPCLALLLAEEGAPSAPGLSANNVLLQAIEALRERRMLELQSTVNQYLPSADGRFFVTTSSEGTARVFDADGWEPITDLKVSAEGLGNSILSPDGSFFATLSRGTCRVWSTTTWKQVHSLPDVDYLGAFDRSGQLLLAGSPDRRVNVWDVEREVVRHRLYEGTERDRPPIFFYAFSPDGSRVLLVTRATVRVLDIAGETTSVLLEVPVPSVKEGSRAIFSPDGNRILVSFEQGGAEMWDVSSRSRLFALGSMGLRQGALAFRADGERLLVGHPNGRAGVWDASSGKRVCELRGLLHNASFSPDGTRILSWGGSRSAELWDAVTGEELASFGGHAATTLGAHYSRSGSTVITASADGVHEWNLESEGERTSFSIGNGGFTRASLDLGGRRIATACASDLGRVQLTDLEHRERTRSLQCCIGPDESSQIESLDFAPDGRSLVAATKESTVSTWDVETGAPLVSFRHPEGAQVYDAEFSPDGRFVVTAASDGRARIWDARTGESLRDLVGHTGGVRSAAFGLGGKRVITASEALVDRTVRIWDADTGEQLTVLRTGGEQPTYACLSPDGSRALAGCWYGMVCVWDVSTGTLHAWKAHPGHLMSVGFSPDGKRILTGSSNPGARLWDAATLDEVLTIDAPGMGEVCASFSADGRWIATSSSDGMVRLWPADPLQRAHELAPRKLTAAEREHYGLASEKP